MAGGFIERFCSRSPSVFAMPAAVSQPRDLPGFRKHAGDDLPGECEIAALVSQLFNR
jgi:hypothetical protein